MNSKSATYNVFQAAPLYQPNNDGKTASVFQFPKPYVAISTDNTNFAELAASTPQQCTGSNRIKLCRKGFPTTADETLLCLASLFFNQDIPALRNCRFLLPEAPQAIYLANGVYHLISRNPRWTSRTIAEQMALVCPPLIVRHASVNQVVKNTYTLIEAILFCHPTWMHVKQLRNHTSQQSN